ncbi:MAG TPA: DNA replication/repair protein RecF, partial [Thermoanaerobacterales bacterium]|nr:DNA replication/repair protein RecF [Thermoanaerobacterales bacterium]
DSDMIKWGEKRTKIGGKIIRNDRPITIEILLDTEKKKEIKINGIPNKKTNELVGSINVVIFSPEDLDLVKGPPANRRQFLDGEISQIDKGYRRYMSFYNRVLFQRNSFLRELPKKGNPTSNLHIWDKQLTELGARIIKKRLEIIKKLGLLSRLMHRKITSGTENLELKYISTLDIDDTSSFDDIKESYKKKLEETRENEIYRGVTLSGPHRDDLGLYVNNIDMRRFGSQGQQRTTALALKLAELELIKSEVGNYPILILDDVFSELDDSRRSFLLNVIDKVQTFMTMTNIELIDLKDIKGEFKIYRIRDGKITGSDLYGKDKKHSY